MLSMLGSNELAPASVKSVVMAVFMLTSLSYEADADSCEDDDGSCDDGTCDDGSCGSVVAVALW